MKTITRKIDKLGRIVLPIDYRRALALSANSEVIMSINGDTIFIKGSNSTCKICGKTKGVQDIGVCTKCIKMIQSI